MIQLLRNFCNRFRAWNVGSMGERAAADWLRQKRGFVIIARNWRNPKDHRDELDLVCRDREILVFVEVKTRSAGALVPGYFAVDRRKKRVVRRACDAYLRELKPGPRTFRFDVVEVTIHPSGGGLEVLHFENVPIFSKQYRG